MLEGIGRHDPTAFTGVVGCWDMSAVSTTPISGIALPDPDVWWRYDGDGSTVTDYGTLGLTGTVSGGPAAVSADGYTFDGTSQYATATYPQSPSTSNMTLAVVCKAASLSSGGDTTKCAVGFGIRQGGLTSNARGLSLSVVRTSTSPDRGRAVFRVNYVWGGGTQPQATTASDEFELGVRTCLIGSYDQSKSIQRLLYADENGKVRFHLEYETAAIQYNTDGGSRVNTLETGHVRIDDSRHWDGSIKEAQVYDGVSLDFRQMLQLAQNLLGIEFELPHYVDTSGNDRHLYAEAPEQFGTIYRAAIAPEYLGAAFDGSTQLWFPDPQDDLRITGDMAFGLVLVAGDQPSTRSVTTTNIAGVYGVASNIQEYNYLWGLQLVGDSLYPNAHAESGTGTDRSFSDASMSFGPGGPYHAWVSRISNQWRIWQNGMLSDGSPGAAEAASPGNGALSTLRLGGLNAAASNAFRGAMTSLIVISGTTDDTDAAAAYAQTLGAPFPREVP